MAKVDQSAAAELAQYGITRVPVDYYHYREFRYTNLADAIAEAKRGSAKSAAVDKKN